MIQTTTVSGRPAQVAYIGADQQPVEPDDAVLIKVLFTDDEGGAVFLIGPHGEPVQKSLLERWQETRARARELLKFDPSEPRDDHGRWSGGGGDDTTAAPAGTEHPGDGYSAQAYVKDGVIHTNDVYDAVRALHENRKVELKQPHQITVLLDKLGEITKQMIEQGEKAPTFDLCNVTIKGTNLFCADAKGIPRVEMPQLTKGQDEGFFNYLKGKGYKVEAGEQYASFLRATQSELNGGKVAGIAKAMREGEYHKYSNPIFVSKDDYILDGHHRWAAEVGNDAADDILGNGKKMAIWRVDIGITKLLEEAETFTEGKGKLAVDTAGRRRAALWRALRVRAEALLKFSPDQPRDDDGKWTSGGSSDGGASTIPETFTPHEPPTPGEQRIIDGGNKVTRAKSGSMYPNERDHFIDDLPLYNEHLNANTTYGFMQTPKGIATANLHDVYGTSKPTVEIHWLIAHDRGAGRSGMELMTKAADKHGVTLQLYAVPLPDKDTAGKKLSIPKLEKFYASFGFKKFGRRDSDGYALMKRQPVKAKKAYDPSEPRDDTGKWTSGGGGTTDKPKGKPATKDDFDKAKIKLDARPEEQSAFIDRWNEKVGVDPATFKHNFMGGLDGTMSLAGGGAGQRIEIRGNVTDANGRTLGEFTRGINLDEKSAQSAYFKLNSSATGHDVGKKMLAGNVDTYQKLGIETVKVGANIDVGGYAWAKYGYIPTPGSWSSLRADLERKLGGGSSSSSGPPNANSVNAEEWDDLSSDVQSDVRDRWMRDSYDSFYNSEVENWRDNGDALNDAKYVLADEFTNNRVTTGDVPGWINEALDSARSDREENGQPPIPFTNRQLLDAIDLKYESNRGDGSDDPDISFDDGGLQHAIGFDPDQMTLPGIEPVDASQRLTQDMRDQIEKTLTEAFNTEADDKANGMDPPQHLSENVSEYQDEYWDQFSDREKLDKAREYDMAYYDVPADDEEPQQEMELPSTPAEDALLTALQSPDPKSIWKVADDPRGKRLLLGTSWSGVLNLKDPEQMARFNAYVGRANG